MPAYRLQGLVVGSDFPLPDLRATVEEAEPDLWLHGGCFPPGLNAEALQQRAPSYESPLRDAAGRPWSRMWRCGRTGIYYFRFIEGFSWAVDAAGRNLWIEWPEQVSLEIITAFLLGPLLAFVLHLRGQLCLHASAVAVDGRAVLFAGDAGMGKSSTAAALAARGYPVLSDDVSAIRREPDGRMMVLPAVPRVYLWPDAAEFVYGRDAAANFPAFLPAEAKRLVRLDDAPGKFQSEPAPLDAIYLLAPRSPDSRAPLIEPVRGADRLVRLMYNGFMTLALDREQTAREFPILGQIARTVRIQELVPSTDPRRMDALCALVIGDVRKVAPALALP